MSGILHIFRTQPDAYQVNYTLGPRSWARVMNRTQLEEILVTPGAFDDMLIARVFDELTARDSVTVSDVSISENEAAVLGFDPMPTDS